MTRVPRNTVLVGDALARLKELPDACIDCVVTSPPWYAQRDFGMGGQIGLEASVDAWVARLRAVMRCITRVLKPTGSVWLDLGDTYSRRKAAGAPVKSLLLAPERLALSLLADGWLIRQKVIWAKTNPMPSVASDRLTATYDVVYLLARSRRYHFDRDAVREQIEGEPPSLGSDPGDVWRIAGAQFPGPHFATFPPKLVQRPLLATCPAKICTGCGAAWVTTTTSRRVGQPQPLKRDRFIRRHPVRYRVLRENPRLVPGCNCDGPTQPGIVLDPFLGAGTVGLVAGALGRDWIGIELNPAYAKLARDRINQASQKAA